MPPVFWYVLWPVLGALGVTLLLVAQPIGAPRTTLWEWLARQDVARRAAERARRVDPAPPVVPWPAIDRVLGPLLADAAALLSRLQKRFGGGDPARLAQIRLVRPGTTASGWLGQKLALAALVSVIPALAGVLFRVFDVPDLFVGLVPWWVWALLGIAGYMSADRAVNGDLDERRRRLRAALPALLQTLVIGSSAGLSLQACLRLVARDGTGPLVEAIRGMLRDLDAGRYRSTAWRASSTTARSSAWAGSGSSCASRARSRSPTVAASSEAA